MKWLFLSNEDQIRGGAQSCCKEVAKAAIADGAHVTFACLRENPYQDMADAFPSMCTVTMVDRVEPRSLRPASLKAAWRVLRSVRPDVIFFANTPSPNFFSFLALSKLAGVAHCVVSFGTDVEMPAPLPSRTYIGGWVRGANLWRREFLVSASLAYKFMTLGLFNNDDQMKNWRAATGYPERVSKLWNYPVDLSKFRQSERLRREVREEFKVGADDVVIGGVGTLNAQKSFDLSIRALRLVLDRVPGARLVIAGDGNQDALLRLSAELGVRERVLLLGGRDDIPRLMNGFDIFCMPSTHIHESLGIVYLEAQATGVPIVVPDLPGPRRVAREGESGVVVERGNPEAFATAWANLAADLPLRQRLVAAGRENVLAFGREHVYRGLLREMRVA